MDKHDLRKASRLHMTTVAGRLPQLEKNRIKPVFYSIDKSLLLGEYTLIIQRWSLMEWFGSSAKFTSILGVKYSRVMPLKNKTYSPTDIKKIKFTLHTILALGCQLYIPTTIDDNYLSTNFGVNNILVVKGGFSISADNVWESNITELEITEKTDHLSEFSKYENPSWRAGNDVFRLSYGKNSFTAGVVRKDGIKEKFGDFLYFLQGGKCAISGDIMDPYDFSIDHIYPASTGGSNTLINLQAVKPSENLLKSNKFKYSESLHYSMEELEALELDALHPYSELVKRNLNINPFSYIFL